MGSSTVRSAAPTANFLADQGVRDLCLEGHTAKAPHMVGIEPAIKRSKVERVINCTTRSLLVSRWVQARVHLHSTWSQKRAC
jgi:hypothetical protein